MQQFFIAIILVLGLGGWWLYSENQTLKENNVKLEAAVKEQAEAMEALRESYEKQGKSLMNMSRRNAEIEAEKAEYLAIFSRHNLDMLALKKPGLIENRMNKASEEVMEGLENDTEELYKLTDPSTDN
jgi:alpha-glucosidase (family GH31 glycosyl hydrolase)|tara:strand:+ start:13693 stop:14076 length:384 start_codon:yes stop_codon:yes gene_type:complete